MQTPEHILTLNSPTTELDAATEIMQISSWFAHCQDVTPKFRQRRLDALKVLVASGLKEKEIAEMCGLSIYRVKALKKDLVGGN